MKDQEFISVAGLPFKVNELGIQEGDTVTTSDDVIKASRGSNSFGFMSMYIGASFIVPEHKVVTKHNAEKQFVDNATVIIEEWDNPDKKKRNDKSEPQKWSKIVLDNGLFVSTNWLTRRQNGRPVYDLLHESLYSTYKDVIVDVTSYDQLFEEHAGEELTCVAKVEEYGTFVRKYYAFVPTSEIVDSAKLDAARKAQDLLNEAAKKAKAEAKAKEAAEASKGI